MSYEPPAHPPYGPGVPAGYPPPASGIEHPQGTTVLVLGIVGLVVCGLLGPFAWVMGNRVLREIDAAPPGYFSNRGNVVAGRICGIIATVLLILGIVFAAVAVTVWVNIWDDYQF
ncbi:MAG: hypothetical protein QOI15_2995 [Pseudonocardiales bacterium]|nr:hypothetical protein [Pseudonocardiales bacterium]